MLHPPVAPFATGFLDRPDGARLFWETSGNPHGRPALYAHGGPGGGLGTGGYRRRFDPELYFLVGLDQRGCGKSTPWACDDLATLETQTMDDLIADLEALRDHLDIEQWLLHGVSWGSTGAAGQSGPAARRRPGAAEFRHPGDALLGPRLLPARGEGRPRPGLGAQRHPRRPDPRSA
ncbi:alpha/beta fold hydrolase [Microbacterium sp.]|uniref:alpha/beta fold hydrolase n=1 Tax=Microbacterium sp. TaxID=51671 RepID=UPI0025E2A9B2|nr:alpha/beta fold hydrolase [Microbacterium sp.]